MPVVITHAIQRAILNYARDCDKLGTEVNLTSNLRAEMERIDQAYYRTESSAKTTQEKMSEFQNKNEIDDFKVPIVETQVESAHSYLCETFLTGFPIFGIVSDKEGSSAAVQLEAIMAQHEKIGWHNQLSMYFRDGLRYNMAFLEAEWFIDYIPALQDSSTAPNGVIATTDRWQGNKLTRWDPYNTFWDPRVKVSELHTYGEYVGTHQLWNRIRLKKFVADQKKLGKALYNAKEVFKSVNSGVFEGVYFPNTRTGTAAAVNGTDWTQFGNMGMFTREQVGSNKDGAREQDTFQVTTLYARIIPEDFGMTKATNADYPQIWKFVIVNGLHVLIAEALPNAHNFLPVFGCQPHDENLGSAARSMADSATGFQAISSGLWKIAMNGARRHLTDRAVYDPSKIDKAQINNPNPSAKIPLRPAAYGTDIRSVIYQLPTSNLDTGALINQAQQVFQFANMANGQNQAAQGQFVKGNKTKFEYQDIMGNSTSRNRQYALAMESQALVPLKFALLYNILQFQPVQTLFNPKTEENVEVNPATLRQAVLEFQVSDGYRPGDKLMDGDSWNTAVTMFTQNPALGAEYDMGGMIAYLMEQRGADVTKFRKSPEQRAYEQAMQAWSQTVAEAATNKGATQVNIPQPKPQDYGYNPGQVTQPTNIPTGPTQ